jgi:hypothetical protein
MGYFEASYLDFCSHNVTRKYYRQNYLTDMPPCLTLLSCIFQHLNQHGVGTTVR